MTRLTFLRPLAIAALALLAASPTSALAAKQPKTAFRIVLDCVARYNPPYIPDYECSFHAWGAISDAGTMGGTGQYWVELWGKNATYVVFLDPATGTFEIWLAGTLLGTGTYAFEHHFQGWRIHDRYEFNGALVGG